MFPYHTNTAIVTHVVITVHHPRTTTTTQVRKNRAVISQHLHRLPEKARTYLASEKFVASCLLEFDRCDLNHNGELDLSELGPVVESVLGFSSWAITTDHVRKFADIFDADGNGVITSDEFLEFSQFLLLMTYLQVPSLTNSRTFLQ